jgi:dUTP pyrophosphatase
MSQENTVLFAKVNPTAIIPSKRLEDAGFDIYACFDELEMTVNPGEIKLIPTGIASSFSTSHVMVLKERGSTGTKGMALRCGIIDSGFRNEWFVPINNTSTKKIVITKDENRIADNNETVYPYSKAIAQALLLPVPQVNIEEVSYEEIQQIKSERGLGQLGSSNK